MSAIEDIYAHFREVMPDLPESHEEGLLEWRLISSRYDYGANTYTVSEKPTSEIVLVSVDEEGEFVQAQLRFANDLEYRGRVRIRAV